VRKILIIGLILRLAVMVFTLHGDLFFIWGGPVKFVTDSVLSKKNYPPLSFLTFALLSPLYLLGEKVGWWILRLPYLLVDLAIVKLLFKLLPQDKHRSALILWWLNPAVLFVTYAQGQIEIIVAAFLLFSVVLVKRSKNLALLAYSTAVAYKTIPVFFLPTVSAYLGDNRWQRAKLFLIGISLPVVFGLLFWKLPGFDVINSYFPKASRPQLACGLRPDAAWKCVTGSVGLLGYVVVLLMGLYRKEKVHEFMYAKILFSAAAFYAIGSSVTVIHRYIMLMPLFVLWAVKKKWSAKLVWGWLILIFLGLNYTWPLQEGLIKYWYPQAINKLALREAVAPLVNYEHIALAARMIADVILVRLILSLWLTYPIKKLNS